MLVEFGIPMKLVWLTNTSLNETYSTIQVGKHLPDMLPIKNGLKQGDALLPLLVNTAVEDAINTLQSGDD
jgi:hypothetical protein